MNTNRWLATAAAASLLLGACDLDLNDPNFPPEEVVFNDPTGLLAVGIGLQAEFADQIVDPVYAVGLVTDEIGAGSATFQNFKDADAGAPLDPTTDLSTAPWTGMFRVIKLSNDLLTAVPGAQLAPGTASGLLALAGLHKAMALGFLIQLYEQVPLNAGIENPEPSFDSRQAVLTEVLRLLEEARGQITATPPSAEFNTQVAAPGFDLATTTDAMLARYNLIAGNLAAAEQAAERVGAPSELRYSSNDINSIRTVMYLSGNAWQMRPEQTFRTGAEPGDERVSYWVQAANVAGAHAPLDELNQYRADDDPFPIFLPDEMKLIGAEAAVRQNRNGEAIALINEVRTQCFSGTGEPTEPMACLPPLDAADLPDTDAILDEILRQRRYELYLQGTLYEDLRRFGRDLKYPWVPYPTAECDRNANAPC